MPKISKKEQQRRTKISASLKAYHKRIKEDYKQLLELGGIDERQKISSKTKRSNKNKSTKTKSTKKISKRSTRRTKNTRRVENVPSKSNRVLKAKKTKRKVKSFPDKKNKKDFFISDKLELSLNRQLDIRNDNNIQEIKNLIKPIAPKIIKFYETSKGKKRKKRMNLGYTIKMTFYPTGTDKSRFPSKVSNKRVIETTSYLPSFIVSKRENITKNLKLLLDDITKRFQEYLQRLLNSKDAFSRLTLKGFVAEMEN